MSRCGCVMLMAVGVILLVMLFSSSSRSTNSTPVTTRRSLVNVRSSPASTSARSQSGTTTTQYISSRSNANIRSCPRTSCATVQSLVSGTRITSTGQVEGEFVLGSSKWTRILLNNKEAFVHSALVSRSQPSTLARPTATTASRSVSRAPNVNPNQTTTTYYISAPVRANARSCPRTTCNRVASFARGAAVNVLQRVSGESVSGNSSWQAVKHNNAVVYIHAPLLSRSRPQPQQAQPAQPAAAQPQQAQPAQPAQVSVPAQPTADTRPAYRGLSCKAIREQYGDGNFGPDHPAYTSNRDRDNDNIACEL